MDIFINQSPRHLQVTQTMAEDLICDPVMAAKVICGFDLDVFQRVRLRRFWWVPEVIDDSGFGTGKTLVEWVYCVLRCILVGHFGGTGHWAAVYYPTFGTGKRTFWPYFYSCRHPIFRAQLGRMEDEKEKKSATPEGADCYYAYFRNGAQAMMPAPSFAQNAETQKSLSLNTLVIGEWSSVQGDGKGIDVSLMGRVRKSCFNEHHPIWCNHKTLTATAKPTSHPSSRRVTGALKRIAKGDTTVDVFRFSCKDFSHLPSGSGKSFHEEYGVPARNSLKTMVAGGTLSRAEAVGEAYGIRLRNGEGWYSDEILAPCVALGKRMKVNPVLSRAEDLEQPGTEPWMRDHTYYFGGADTAPAQGKKSDSGAFVLLRARPRVNGEVRKPRDIKLSAELSNWHVSAVYGRSIRAMTAGQNSALMHEKHRHFGLTKLVMDHGGGGQWIWPELAKGTQEINGILTSVRPIVTPDNLNVHHSNAEYILALASRGDASIAATWPELRGDDNLVDTFHTNLRGALEKQHLALMPGIDERDKEEWADWPAEKKYSLIMLTALKAQLEGILVDQQQDGTWVLTKNGARQFSSKGKKDLVSALYFAWAGFVMWLKANEPEWVEGGGSGGDGWFGG